MKILLPNKRAELGRLGEEFARAEYARQGFRIIASNIFNRRGKKMGELDFIALNGRDIVFVEVKTRSAASARFGPIAGSVNFAKRRRLVLMVHLFLRQHKQFLKFTPRIDVCIVVCGLDNRPKNAIIIPNAVDDEW